MNRKYLRIIMVLLLCLAIVPLAGTRQAHATDIASGTIDGTSINWSVSDSGVLSITGSGAIPDYSTSGGVTTAPWGAYKDSITSLVVGEGITQIGRCAFYRLANMTSAKLPASCTYLDGGNYAYTFAYTGLTSLPDLGGVVNLPGRCFYYCTGLTEAFIPEGITSVGYETFYHCDNLVSASLPKTCTYIASSGFIYCGSLETLTINGVIEGFGSSPIYKPADSLVLTFTVRDRSSITSASHLYLVNDSSGVSRVIVYGIPGVPGAPSNGAPRDVKYYSYNNFAYNFKSARNIIKFDANGGVGTMADLDHTYIGTYNDVDYDVLPANTFTREGARFVCWTTEKSVSAEDLQQFDWGMTRTNFFKDQVHLPVLVPHDQTVTLYAQWLPDEEYNIWVGGVRVNSMNKGDVLGDGTVSYDPSAKTLTLNGYNSGASPAQHKINDSTGEVYSYYVQNATIYTPMDGLTINVTADSTVCANAANYLSCSVATIGGVTINISEGVTLDLKGNTAATNAPYNAFLYGGAVINGPGSLVASGHVSTGNRSIALYSDIVVDKGATVTLTGGSSTAYENVGYGLSGYPYVKNGVLIATGSARAVSGKIKADAGLSIFYGADASNVDVLPGNGEYLSGDWGNYVKVKAPEVYSVALTGAAGMDLASSTFSVNEGDSMTFTVKAADGYYFPEDYAVAASGGITVTRDSYTQLTISGSPTGNVDITLPAATAKTKLATPAASFTATGKDTGALTIPAAGLYTITYKDSSGNDDTMNTTQEGSTSWPIMDIGPGIISITRIPNFADPAETATKLASDAQSITVTKADVPVLTAVQPAAIGGKGSIPTTAAHELSTDAAAWTACSGETADLAAGTYYVRTAASGAVLTSEPQTIVINEFVPSKEDTPEATLSVSVDDSGKLTGVGAGMQYSTDGSTWTDITADGLVITDLEPGTLYIRTKGNGTTTVDSDPQAISITRAETPALTAVQPDDADGSGSSIPTTSAHEYSADGGATWTKCTGALKDLEQGSYLVRVAASGTALASEPETVVIKYAPEYIILEGAGSVYTLPEKTDAEQPKGTETPDAEQPGDAETPSEPAKEAFIEIRSNGKYKEFLGIQVDGKDVDKSLYESREGSTIVTLPASYLDTIAPGEHTLTFLFSYGQVSAPFTVKPATPQTGDSSVVLWGVLLGVAVIAAAGTAVYSAKRKKH